MCVYSSHFVVVSEVSVEALIMCNFVQYIMLHYKGSTSHYLVTVETFMNGVHYIRTISFYNLGARCSGWSTPRPGRFTLGKTRYPLNRRLGGHQGRSRRVRKISPPPGFNPRIVQPVASRYTDWATPTHWLIYRWESFFALCSEIKYTSTYLNKNWFW
jgi:hypothetical protein